MAILNAPYKTTEIDMGCMRSKPGCRGSIRRAGGEPGCDQFSSVLPPAVALKAAHSHARGLGTNLAVASQTDNLVAVIGCSSPAIQIIDASNNPLDVANNSSITAYTAPVTRSTAMVMACCSTGSVRIA